MNQSWIRLLPAFLRTKLEGRAYLQNVVSNAGWLFVDHVLRMAVGLLVGIWVTRYLGPEQYGLLSYAIAFVALFSSVALLGLEGITVRNLVRDPSRSNEILGSTFLLRIIGAAVAVGLTMTSILLLRPDDTQTLLLVGITALGALFQVFGTIDFWFQSQVKSRYSAYARSAANLVICAIKVAMILLDAPLVAFACAGAIEMVLGAMGIVIAYRLTGCRMTNWRATRVMAMDLLRDSWPLFFSDIVALIYLRVDRIVIGEMAGNVELGIYSVAALLAEAFYFIPVAICHSVFPSLVEAKGSSEELFDARMQQFYNLMALLGYLVALPMTFLAGWLVPLLFGGAYARAAPMLVGLVWAGLFYNLMVARSQYLTAMNWMRLNFITDFLGCLLNVALIFVLIPRYGGMGAVFASIISYWFVAHGSCLMFKPLFKNGIMLTKAMLYPKVW
jgi:O-antigen/teichoic acid export membrane protein